MRLGDDPGSGFIDAARNNRLQLKVVDVKIEEARDLYGADLALIRPDQIVAWRGNSGAEAERVFAKLTAYG